MQVRQEIAGALFDFVGSLTTRATPIVVGATVEVYALHEHFQQWAAERGLDLDGADVEGWTKSLASREKERRLPPGEELKCQIAEALGYDLDHHAISRMVIILEAGGEHPLEVQVTDMTLPDYEHDVVETFKEWVLRPTLADEQGRPIAEWNPEKGGYVRFDEKGPVAE